jgi:hypothetical protein
MISMVYIASEFFSSVCDFTVIDPMLVIFISVVFPLLLQNSKMVHHPKHIDEHPREGEKLCNLVDFELWKNRYIALHLLKLAFALGRFKFQ